MHLLLCSFSIMARKTLFDGWKSVRSPANISRWHWGRFCHDKVATSLWLTVVRSSVGVVVKGFIPRRPRRGVLTGGDFSKLAVFVPGKCSFLQTGEHRSTVCITFPESWWELGYPLRSSVSIIPCALIQTCFVSFVSIGLSKPGIVTLVTFSSSSSIDCEIALIWHQWLWASYLL